MGTRKRTTSSKKNALAETVDVYLAAVPGKARAALGSSLLGGMLVGLAAWIPFALWVLGIIKDYRGAVAVALAVGVGVSVVFLRALRRREGAASPA